MSEVVQSVMQAYFHQDWIHEFASIDRVVDCIVEQSSKEFVDTLICDLQNILSTTQSEGELELVFDNLKCDYIPVNARVFVSEIVRLLKYRSKVR